MVTINNAINNTVGASNSGVTNTLTVTNASNTSSSQALVNVTVGGTSSGDAFTTYTVSGTTNWSEGIDNSVTGDPFVIAASTALGTTNVVSMATTGEINYPLQPCFSAYLGGDATDVTGDGTLYTVIFGTEQTDAGSDYDNTTGTFTAPVTGKYQFNTTVTMKGVLVGHTTAAVQIVATGLILNVGLGNPFPILSAGGLVTYSGSALILMSASQTCVIKVQVTGGTKVVDLSANLCNFSGYLVA